MPNYPYYSQMPMYQQMNYQNMYQPQIQNQGIPARETSNFLNGRFVSRIEDVTANEISMDGSVSVFPTNDMKEIYCKQWKADGTIQTVKFVQEQTKTENATNVSNENIKTLYDGFREYYDEIIERLDKLEKQIKPQSVTKSRKKEEVGVENE